MKPFSLNFNYRLVLNFFWYQTIWFSAILGGEQFEPAIALLIILHLLHSQDRKAELMTMLPCAAIGISVDSFLSWQGLFLFNPAPELLPIPLWLVGIWFGFAGILRHSLNYFVSRPALATCAGAVFAPLTYFAAARLGAVSFGLPDSISALVIGVVWAIMMAAFSTIYHWVERHKYSGQPLVLSTINRVPDRQFQE